MLPSKGAGFLGKLWYGANGGPKPQPVRQPAPVNPPAAEDVRPAMPKILPRAPSLVKLDTQTAQFWNEAIHTLTIPDQFSKGIASRNPLRRRLWHCMNRCDSARHPDWKTSLPGRFFASDLFDTMYNLDAYFLDNYRVGKPDRTLAQSISPNHLERLTKMVQESFYSSYGDRGVLYASMLTPDAIRQFSLKMTEERKTRSDALRPTHAEHLTTDELLALVDYLHPHTFTFRVFNGAQRLKKFWDLPEVADMVEPVYRSYRSALEKLSRNPHFIDRQGEYYKGADLAGPKMFNVEMLRYLLGRKGSIILSHPVSTTSDPIGTFTNKEGHSDNLEFVIKTPTGVDVSLFHGTAGQGIDEVILLDDRLRVTGCEERLVIGGKHLVFTLEHEAPRPPRFSGRRVPAAAIEPAVADVAHASDVSGWCGVSSVSSRSSLLAVSILEASAAMPDDKADHADNAASRRDPED
jgi:hypothetical protein